MLKYHPCWLPSSLATVVILLTVSTGEAQFRRPGGGGGMFNDPAQTFEKLSNGRGYFLLAETNLLRQPLTDYLKEKGISGDKVTKEVFLAFAEQQKAKMAAGGGSFGGFRPGGGNTPGGFGGGFRPGGGSTPGGNTPGGNTPGGPGGFKFPFQPGGPGASPFAKIDGKPGEPAKPGEPGKPGDAGKSGSKEEGDPMLAWAKREFDRRDENGDGKLNLDEMSQLLRAEYKQWDKDNDETINWEEFKPYFLSKVQSSDNRDRKDNRDNRDNRDNLAPGMIVIDQSELDKRPVVYRAGKLPPDLPDWFKQADTDTDGQVGLYEWRQNLKKSFEEFQGMDRNNDGFLTAEEVLYHQAQAKKANGEQVAGGPGFRFGPGMQASPNGQQPWWANFGSRGGGKDGGGKGGKDKGGKGKGKF